MIEAAVRVNNTTNLPWWVLPGLAGILLLMFAGVWIAPKFRAKCVNCHKRPHARGVAWCDDCIIDATAGARLRRQQGKTGNN